MTTETPERAQIPWTQPGMRPNDLAPGMMPEPRPVPPRNPGGAYNIDNLYWKKGPKEKEAGYIIVGPGLETEQGKRWQRLGRIPLRQYSLTAKIHGETGQPMTIESNRDHLSSGGDTAYMYYWLIRNGGISLFPIEQLLEFKWHIKPPMGMKVEAFPQFQEYEIPEPYWCSMCAAERSFLTEGSLMKHAMLMHDLDRIEVKQVLKNARVRPESMGSGVLPALVKRNAQPKAAVETEAPEHQCEDCGKTFEVAIALAGHRRSHLKDTGPETG